MDCGQTAIEEKDYLIDQKSSTTLIRELFELLSEPPKKDRSDIADRLDRGLSRTAELQHRGFDPLGLVRASLVPGMAQLAVGSLLVAVFAGETLPGDWSYHLRTGWGDLLLGIDRAKHVIDIREPQDRKDTANRLAALLPRITTYFSSLSMEELLRWETPEDLDQLERHSEIPPPIDTVQRWMYERFSQTYLATWSTKSLHHEWSYTKGRQEPRCSSRQMLARRVDGAELLELIAERATDPHERTADHAIVGKWTGVAKEKLEQGDRASAVSIFSVACDLSPDSAEAFNNRGFCRLPDDPKGALDDLERAEQLDHPDVFLTRANRMLALHYLQNNASALKLADAAWEFQHQRSRLSIVWDFCVNIPQLVDEDSLLYLARLAAHIACKSGDVTSADRWNERVAERSASIRGSG